MLLSLILQSPSRIETFVVDGARREALVFEGRGTAPHPVVLAFHGHGGGGMRQAARSFAVHEFWPEATVIYPQGLPTKGMNDPDGERPGWQQNAGESGDRDLKLTDAILAWAKAEPKRTFAMGHSNGGRFTYVLWGAPGNRFAAYGPSGSPGVGMVRTFRPAPAFVTAGEADPIIAFRIQKATIDRLARLNGVDFTKGEKKGYVTLAKGKDGLEMGTYIHPGGHEYPREAGEATVAFFKRR